jgi:hypothetical protein
MRIIEGSTGKSIASVSLLLTPGEASELADTLNGLDPKVGGHGHVADMEYQREITVVIYTRDNLHFFSEEVRKALGEDGGES